MNRDPELPNGFQDADFDMRELEAAGNKSTRLRKRGICDHGWNQTKPDGTCLCLHCNVVFASWDACMEARREALS